MNLQSFTNLYPVSKTIKFKLIPIGKTLENLNINRIIEKDETRAKEYKRAKELIDCCHRDFIESSLTNVNLKKFEDYIRLCQKKSRTGDDNDKLNELASDLRKEISEIFTKQENFKKLFGKEIITEILPAITDNENDLAIIKNFEKFTTAFVGFHSNRQNMYTSDEIPTAVGYRLVNDNLPKYISNIYSYEKVKDILADEIICIDEALANAGLNLSSSMCFSEVMYGLVLTQKGIDTYNAVIGGWIDNGGRKIQGLNEYVNLYNQKLNKSDKSNRLPKFQMLFKQILTEADKPSYVRDGLSNDKELLLVLKEIFEGEDSIYDACVSMTELIKRVEEYNLSGIFVANGQALNSISNGAFNSWSVISDSWKKEYRIKNPIVRMDLDNYDKKVNDAYKKIISLSLFEINDLVRSNDKKYAELTVENYLKVAINSGLSAIEENYKGIHNILDSDCNQYSKTSEDLELIKKLLDSIKDFEYYVGLIRGQGLEADRDEIFYGEYALFYERIRQIDIKYDLVRNYVTKKPFSSDKFKLYFEQGDFLSGWDAGGNGGKRSAMLLKDGKFYLMISKTSTLPLMEICDDESIECYEKIDYRLLSGANKMLPKVIFSKAHKGEFCPDKEIERIKESESFKKGKNFNIDDCHKLIEFYQKCIFMYEWGNKFDFKFKKAAEYEDISKFYKDVENQGYRLVRQRVNKNVVDSLVEKGEIYLFQIYNKDFSEYSHGRSNLHTLYFKALFEEDNQSVIKINGGAEIFMRKSSIDKENRTIHPMGKEIASKNALNTKRASVFNYDIVKDKRYTVDQFEFHVPIQINWTALGNARINERVREALYDDSNPHVIGIDRGERNLLYICVIDGAGRIVEQYSLNNIINEFNGTIYTTDYHQLLEYKEKERMSARQNWKTIENIKELKEGYISQVVYKICQLVIKYNAIIALEDLNSGFKRGRSKVEKQVYQKFEKALIDKLNYLSDKKLSQSEEGSIIRGYQLTEKFDGFSRMKTQNGIMFYIPAWLTSKIDPTTGFADLLKPKYESIELSKNFIMSFDKIYYSFTEDMFVFELDYTKFLRTDADYKKNWELYTYGERVQTFRNKDKNGEWDYKIVELTSSIKQLLNSAGIAFEDGHDIRNDISQIESKQFYMEFINIVRLMLQMRNSITGRPDVDFIISPVKNKSGRFYDSRLTEHSLPADADANGAYNIARKVLWAIGQFKKEERSKLSKTKIAISNKEWLEYAQTHCNNE